MTLLHNGVTAGCAGAHYCPGSATTREQMAVFVLVAKEGAGYVPPACATPVFGDPRRGIATGCGGGSYCPAQPVTREQMGVFIGATFGLTLYGP